MKLSRWTITAPIPGRDTTLLIHPLSGEAVLVEAGKAVALSAVPLTGLPSHITNGGNVTHS